MNIRLFPISKWTEEIHANESHTVRNVLYFNPGFWWMGFKKYREGIVILEKPKWQFPFIFRSFVRDREQRNSDGTISPFSFLGFVAYEHEGISVINSQGVNRLTLSSTGDNVTLNTNQQISISHDLDVGTIFMGIDPSYITISGTIDISPGVMHNGSGERITYPPEELYPEVSRLLRIIED